MRRSLQALAPRVALLGMAVFLFALPIPRTPSAQLMALGLMLLAGLWEAVGAGGAGWLWRRLASPVWPPLLVWLLLNLAAAEFAVNERYSMRMYRKGVLMLLAVYVLVGLHARGSQVVRWLQRVVVLSVWWVAGYQVLEYLLGWRDFVIPNVANRAQSFFGHHDNCALFLSLSLPVVLAHSIGERGWWRVYAVGALLAGGAIQLMTFSRAGWVSFGVALGLFSLFWVKGLWVLFLSGAVVLPWLLPTGFLERATSLMVGDRWLAMEAGLRMLIDHPWLGIGPGNRNFVELYPQYVSSLAREGVLLNSHNFLLQLAIESGIPAALAMLTFIGAVFLVSYREHFGLGAEQRYLYWAALGAPVGYLTHSLVSYHFEGAEGFLFFAALAMLHGLGKPPEGEPESSPAAES